jgi:hypothetical protein
MINFENGNLPPCDICNMQKWGVEINEQGVLSPFCIVCSGDIAHTKEARDLAESLLNSNE